MMANFVQIVLRVFILLCCSVLSAKAGTAEYCNFGSSWLSTTYCQYGCCTTACCTYSQYYSSTFVTASTAIQAWVIGVIVAGSVIGLIIVVSIIVCVVLACKGPSASRGGVIRPAPQTGVTVISTGGTQATTSSWAQPAYGPTNGGGYSTATAYGPAPGGVYSTATAYGPNPGVAYGPNPGVAYNTAPVPPSYSYSDPAYPPNTTDKPT